MSGSIHLLKKGRHITGPLFGCLRRCFWCALPEGCEGHARPGGLLRPGTGAKLLGGLDQEVTNLFDRYLAIGVAPKVAVQFSDIAENRACKFAEGVSIRGRFIGMPFGRRRQAASTEEGDFWDRDGEMYRGGLKNRLCRLGQAPPTVWIAIGKSLKVRIGTSETDERLLGAAEGSAFPRIERPALVDLDHPLDIGGALDGRGGRQ